MFMTSGTYQWSFVTRIFHNDQLIFNKWWFLLLLNDEYIC